MEFMTTKEAVEKWNISERRIRQLLQDGRIEDAVKVGNSWNIPIDADKPVDKRIKSGKYVKSCFWDICYEKIM